MKSLKTRVQLKFIFPVSKENDKQKSRMVLVGNYMFKVNNRNARTRCEICSGVFTVNFEHISHLVLVFLLLPF